MSIEKYYVNHISTKRLTQVGATDKESYQTYLADVRCRIEAAADAPTMYEDGATYDMFKMWCAGNTDIKEGDFIVSGSNVYTVRNVTVYNKGAAGGFPRQHHLEIVLSLPR